ncbi:MAG: hypothetical protein WBY73_03500, partial [Candidatus Acidiferrales bacterium]
MKFSWGMKQRIGRKWIAGVGVLVVCGAGFAAQHGASAPKSVAPAQPRSSSQTAQAASSPEFIKAADEVLLQMSKILDLPIKEPLKKSLRSKQEVREYLIREDKDDKNEAQKYADAKTLEAFGLIPRDFPLDAFM